VYETSAIISYIDEAFEGPRLTPPGVRARARMGQWVSAVNSYYYHYMIYHVTHERLVFPELGIASDEKVVAHALPKVELGLGAIERELAHGEDYLLGSEAELPLRQGYGCGRGPERRLQRPREPRLLALQGHSWAHRRAVLQIMATRHIR